VGGGRGIYKGGSTARASKLPYCQKKFITKRHNFNIDFFKTLYRPTPALLYLSLRQPATRLLLPFQKFLPTLLGEVARGLAVRGRENAKCGRFSTKGDIFFK